MTIFFTIIHVLVCMLLILVVLAQQGKGQDLASAFGGGGGSAAFGARGTATLLSKITTVGAIIFMITSLGLSYLRPVISGGSVVPDLEPATEAPEAPWLDEDAVPPDSEEPSGEETSPDEPSSPESEEPEAPPEPDPKSEQGPPNSD